MVPEADARLLFQQLIVAVDYCHRLGIANRDIKVRFQAACRFLLNSLSKPIVADKTSHDQHSNLVGRFMCRMMISNDRSSTISNDGCASISMCAQLLMPCSGFR